MLYTLSQGKLLENHTLHSHTYLYSPYMAVPPPHLRDTTLNPCLSVFEFPTDMRKEIPLPVPASRGAVRSCCPSRHFVFSRIPHRILVKSRILKVPSRPYIKRLFSPRLQNKKGRKGPPDRSLRRRNVKFKPRIKLNHNMLIPQIC